MTTDLKYIVIYWFEVHDSGSGICDNGFGIHENGFGINDNRFDIMWHMLEYMTVDL